METSSNNYSTYIKGSSQDINDCLTIVLFNQKDSSLNDLPRLGLNNIDEYYNKLISEKRDYIMICSRETSTVPFQYEYSTEKLLDGFDTIMYLRNLSLKPIGYTTYSVIQGANIDTKISIDIKNRVFNNKNQELELSNSIKLIIESTIKKNLIGEKSYEYTSCQSVIKDLISLRDSDKFYRYSPYISAVRDSKYGECNLLDFGFVNSSKVYKIDIKRNLKYNPFQINYTNHKISSWEKDDIVIASWVGDKYSIYSLTKRNKFNDLISYTSTPEGYKVIPFPENTTGDIIEIVGRFAKVNLIDDSGNEQEAIFDVRANSWIKTDKSSIKILDPISSGRGLIELPGKVDSSYLSVIRKKLPGITDIHYKLVTGDLIVGKVGNWYIIKPVLDLINEGTLIYTTTSKTIIVSEKEEVLVVNDKILATKSNIGSETYYYFYIADEGYKHDLKDGGDTRYMYWSELAKREVFPGYYFGRTLTGHPIYYTGNGDEYSSYQTLYRNGAIKVVRVGENILGCKNISGFRRNIIDPECLQIPEFLDSFMGLLFYKKENNYLNYL